MTAAVASAEFRAAVEAAETPWLSVVMPIHNGEPWLAATLDSVAAQDCRGIEFIMIDSGEGAGCRDIAAAYADRLAIRYERRPDIKPWTAKTNLAVLEAKAPWIAMLHQDDLWLAGRVETVRNAIDAYPEAAMIVAPSHFIGPDGRKVGTWALPFRRGLQPGSAVGRDLLVQEVIALPAPVIRREAWLATGGIDEALWYTGDWDLYLKLSALGSVAVLPRPTTGFRLHRTSLTMTGSRDVADFRNQMASVLDRHWTTFSGSGDHALRRCAQASIAVNCALAQVAAGDGKAWLALARTIARLGPIGLWRYLRLSRIVDRALPRLRLRLSGAL